MFAVSTSFVEIEGHKEPPLSSVYSFIFLLGVVKCFTGITQVMDFFLVYIREKIIAGEVQEKDPLIISKVQK